MKSVLELPLFQLTANPRLMVHLAINKVADPSSFHPSVISRVPKFQANTKLLPVVFSSFKSTAATIIFSILATQLRHMAPQTRCIANVITTLISIPLQSDANTISR
jgi:hypothetical protein